MKLGRTSALFVGLAALISACGGGPGNWFGTKKTPTESGTAMLVAASFYPIAEIVQRVGGSNIDVFNLTPAGSDAHDIELSAKQLEQLSNAKITFYIGADYQPSVQKSIATIKNMSVDLLNSLDLHTMQESGTSVKDPHVWLDPAFMIEMTRTVTDVLSASRPELATEFGKNSSTYIAELEKLGNNIDTRFTSCESRLLITAHSAFGYFASRAKIDVASVAELNPEQQLSAKQLEELAVTVKNRGVSTIFYEEMISTDLAQTLADKAGVATDTLNPLEGMSNADIKAGKNYITIQEDNLNKISKALRCS